MPQYSFTTDANLILEVDKIADKEIRTRSEMIDLLLRIAVKEKTRKRAKKYNIQDHSTDPRSSNPG